MARTKFGKTRKMEQPYAIFAGDGPFGKTECRVLKTYQSAEKEKQNPYARWFIAITTDATFGGWDIGDSYISDAKALLHLVAATPEWLEEYPYYKPVPTPEEYMKEEV